VSVHIELDGGYAACSTQSCPLPIHLPLDTVEEAEQLPYFALLPLVEAFDPPSRVYPDGEKAWDDEDQLHHRDYGLPAVVHPDGTLMWYQHGSKHRDQDKPAVIYPNGHLHWYQHNVRHRDGDKPAVVQGKGVYYWFLEGVMYKPGVGRVPAG
jgi:hypothetical protein